MAVEPEAQRRAHEWLSEVYSQLEEREALFETISGEEVKPLYTEEDRGGADPGRDLGYPGEYPYTRGVYPSMYRGRLWTMRQFAGFGTAEETNERFQLPARPGPDRPVDRLRHADADGSRLRRRDARSARSAGRGRRRRHARRHGELFAGIDLGEVSISMTINAPAAIVLAFYLATAEEQGIGLERLRRHDPERHPQGVHRPERVVFPTEPSMRLVGDVIEFWRREHVPRGTRSRSAATTSARPARPPLQELAFTLADGFHYVEQASSAAWTSTTSRRGSRFFFNAHNDVFEEIAKYRAARRIWAREMRETYGAQAGRVAALRFHTQTGRRLAARPSSPRSTSSARRSRRSPGCSAAPSRCTRTPRTRPSPCRPRRPSGSPCAPSR